MKYKLININSKEETICEKIVIDGFDYYVISNSINCKYGISKMNVVLPIQIGYDATMYKGIICTNNPSIDLPQVVDDVISFANEIHQELDYDKGRWYGRIEGYNKSQETHPNSDQDMIDFYEWCDTSEEAALFWRRNRVDPDMSGNHNKKIREKRNQLLQLWKDQKPKIVYYEN